jgi:imidazole glycerol-phosphate synthase subunit HisH
MIVIIDGCGANIASVQFAIQRLGKKCILSADPAVIASASHVILPGVGTAAKTMAQLEKFQLLNVLRGLTQPVLGICLGMQILFKYSEEGRVDCLGILSGKVNNLPKKTGLCIPHMGWNQLKIQRETPLLAGIENNSYVYFVHSYAAEVSENTIASTDYTNSFSAIIQKNNYYGVQFHPERSGAVGSKILQNFVSIK